MAYEFCKGYDAKKVVNHKDSIRHLNFYKNLEWITHRENCIHGFIHGNVRPPKLPVFIGDDNPSTKSNNDEVREICELLQHGLTTKQILRHYGVKRCSDNNRLYDLVRRIKTRDIWVHISVDYYF